MNILAVLNVLFYKYTGQRDIIIGSGISGRPHADLQGIIGMFVNMLAMRNAPQSDKAYVTFLREVVDNSVKAFANTDVQFEDLVANWTWNKSVSGGLKVMKNGTFGALTVEVGFLGLEMAKRAELAVAIPGNSEFFEIILCRGLSGFVITMA